MTHSLSFHGAAREVTGSCFEVRSAKARFLVDCGLHQGGREADAQNREHRVTDPSHLDFVLLTHAHIDHSGWLPKLVAGGFSGPVFATAATCDLLGVMLPDAAFIQEREAEWAKKRSYKRRGDEALYTVPDAEDALQLLRPVDYGHVFEPCHGVHITLRDAGHILGSSSAAVEVDGRLLVFSGDLGQPGRPVVNDPVPVTRADFLVMESTYGNRLHKTLPETIDELVEAVNSTLERGGNVVIPSFAVGRTQELLFLLADLAREGRIGGRPQVYVDSPMATKATAITLKHRTLLNAEARELMAWGEQGSPALPVRFVESVEESKRLNELKGGAILIAASGMCEAGRIKHHLLHNLPRPASSVVIVGFQAAGTLGRRLVEGAESVRLFGEDVDVRARIYTIGGLSAHGDRDALLGWLAHFETAPTQTFIVHGEAATAATFAESVRDRFGWNVTVPGPGTCAVLG